MSKDHLPPFFSSGTGNGQSSLPTMMNARSLVFGSTEIVVFSFASAAKSAARCRSRGGSPVKRMSLALGPKICTIAGTSYFAAALTTASAACRGVSKPRAPAAGAPAAAGAAAAERCAPKRPDAGRHAQITAPTSHSTPENLPLAHIDLLSVLNSCDFLAAVMPLISAAPRHRVHRRHRHGYSLPRLRLEILHSWRTRGGCSSLHSPRCILHGNRLRMHLLHRRRATHSGLLRDPRRPRRACLAPPG